jgi:anti-anti-sigma factor
MPTHAPAIVTAPAELDVYTAPKLRKQLVDLTNQGRHHVIVDLGATARVDSSGLAVLVGHHKRTRDHGGALVLADPGPEVLKALVVTGLLRALRLADSVQDATAMLTAAPSADAAGWARDAGETPLDLRPVIAGLSAWLINVGGSDDHQVAMRLMKIGEEFGEVTQAYIGVTGQNPRKGVTHASADVADELCDVIVTAMVALHDHTADPAALFAGKLAKIADRVGVAAADV